MGLGILTQSPSGLAPASAVPSVPQTLGLTPFPRLLSDCPKSDPALLPPPTHPTSSAVLFAPCSPPISSPGTETGLGGAASIFLLPRTPQPCLPQAEVSG